MDESGKSRADIFKEVKVQKTSDVIISQIQNLIKKGVLKSGEKLPSERELAERFKVGRGPLRDALKKLEFYGILNSVPFKGTYIAAMEANTISGLIANLLELEECDFESIMESRAIIEVFSAALSAVRATEEDKAKIKERFEMFEAKFLEGSSTENEDFLLHVQIAYASKNALLKSFISIFTPNLISLSLENQDKEKAAQRDKLKEHRDIVESIYRGDEKGAFMAMKIHMENAYLYRFGKNVEIFNLLK